MLSIRLQRLGRKGYPVYRVVVQDSRQSPTSGKYVALLGNYNPHTKTANLVKDKAELFLKNGAQPSDRVVSLFKAENIALPSWVNEPVKQERKIRNPEKLRKNRPADAEVPVAEAQAEGDAAEAAAPAEGEPENAEASAPEGQTVKDEPAAGNKPEEKEDQASADATATTETPANPEEEQTKAPETEETTESAAENPEAAEDSAENKA